MKPVSRTLSVLLLVGVSRLAAADVSGDLLGSDESLFLGEWSTAPSELKVSSTEAAAWTLRYPTLFLSRSIGASPWAEAIRAYEEGRLVEALIAFEQTPVEARDADYFVYNAHFLLLVGDEAEAGVELGKALVMAPEHPGAQALQAIAAVREGRGDAALTLARRATAGDPTLPAAHLALSYAYQANRDLPSARASANAAIQLDPDNALTHLRLAELDLATGDVAAARSRADRAVALSPSLPDAKNVLGFVQLSQDQPELAVDTFKTAIRFNAQEPAGHFGLGLAYVRQGKPDLGREQLEIATKLAPTSALPHTYLGRTYDLLGRDREAAEQYAAAIKADPLDPVPYRFDAVRQAAANAPVSASARMQAALDRVDKRAVYRATDLLAEDRALYLADLANLEGVLGQDDRARLDAARAETQDYNSGASHLAVGDALARLPRAGLAKQSEYLQALLRQPLGSLPPPLAISEAAQASSVTPQLGFFRAATPERTGYNEFGALFNKMGAKFDWNLMAGSRDSFGDQLSAATAIGKVGLAVNQLYFRTDGFLDYDGMRNSVLRGVLQFDPGPNTRLHLEYQDSDGNRKGQDPDWGSQQAVDERRGRSRLAFRQRLGGGGELVLLASREEMEQQIDFPPVDIVMAKHDGQDVRDINLEAQYLRRFSAGQWVAGFASARQKQSYRYGQVCFDLDGDGVMDLFDYTGDGVPDGCTTSTVSSHDWHTRTAYFQATYRLNPEWEVHGGLAADQQDGSGFKQHFISPSLGVNWQPMPGATLRLGAMRGLNRYFLTGATLEPVQVNGFQFLGDDLIGRRSDLVGLGWDQRLAGGWDWGVELNERKLRIPTSSANEPEVQWRERNSRAWLTRLLSPSELPVLPSGWEGVISLTYDGQEYTRHTGFLGFLAYHPEHLRLAGRLFGANGLGLELGLTWVELQGTQMAAFGYQDADEHFPVADLALSWKLPKRRGQVSLGAMNLFDRNFTYVEMDPANPRFAPERYLYGRLQLAF